MADFLNNFSVEKIVNRFNDAIIDVASVQKAINIGDIKKRDKSFSDAGEAISQTIEWAVRRHIIVNDDAYYNSLGKDFRLPEVLKNEYWDDASTDIKPLIGQTIEGGDSSSVDFSFLIENKGLVTNFRKHTAKDFTEQGYEIQKRYIEEVRHFIETYISREFYLKKVLELFTPEMDSRLSFYSACNEFEKRDCLYVLLVEKNNLPSALFANYCRIPLGLVVDFDMSSMQYGFAKAAFIDTKTPYKPIIVTDRVTSDTFPLYQNETPIIFANGFVGKNIAYSTFRDWNKNYSDKLAKQLETFFATRPEQKTIVISLLTETSFLRGVFDIIDKYAKNTKLVIANDKHEKLHELADEYGADYINISLQELDRCLSDFATPRNISEKIGYKLPCIAEATGVIPDAEFPEIDACFEVLYEGIGDSCEEEPDSFLKGETPLSWEGAHRQFAAERSRQYRMYVDPVEKALSNGRGKMYIIHEPGYGGTTAARQIAYALHDRYPTIFLKQYLGQATKSLLERIHKITRKPVAVFAEIPQKIKPDEFESLFNMIPDSRPILLIGIKRGTSKDTSNNILHITNWNNDVSRLVDKYKPYLERYSGGLKKEKQDELKKIQLGDAESYKLTPFYIGLLIFQEEFFAIKSYVKRFVDSIVNNESQRKVLIYLSICDYFRVKKSIPEGFFATVFNIGNSLNDFNIEHYFNEADGILKCLLNYDNISGVRYWSIRHPFFTQELLPLLLNGGSIDKPILLNLGVYCKNLIEDIADSAYSNMLQEDILQPLFIGSTAERAGENFTPIIQKLENSDREDVFRTLHERFPDNPHFCSHLARYYSKEIRDFDKALEYADKAINLCDTKDYILYHIKAMCFFHKIRNFKEDFDRSIIKNYKKAEEELEIVISDLLPQAETCFQESREIQKSVNRIDEITYLPHIRMLVCVFDFAIKVKKLEKRIVLGESRDPYARWIDDAQSLLEEARRIYAENVSEQYSQCEYELWDSIMTYTEVMDLLRNQIPSSPHPSLVRRMLARVYFHKNEGYKQEKKTNNKILSLMEENIKMEPTNEKNYYLWFNAARYSTLSRETILSRLSQWNSLQPSVDVSFYCFAFNAIKAIQGDSTAAGLAKRLLSQCNTLGGNHQISIKEWYANTSCGLVRTSELDPNKDQRMVVKGIIEYNHPGDARIILDCGLDVFFRPYVNSLTEDCNNRTATCFVGFSYDGMRAFDESVKILY